MKLWQRVLLRLLYLTPAGYLISTASLLQGEKITGISLVLERYSPVRVKTKRQPSFNERVDWFVNGVFLIIEGWFVLFNNIAGDIGGVFALVAFIFGLVSLISALFPRLPWNRFF